jgi:hypothetical protein
MSRSPSTKQQVTRPPYPRARRATASAALTPAADRYRSVNLQSHRRLAGLSGAALAGTFTPSVSRCPGSSRTSCARLPTPSGCRGGPRSCGSSRQPPSEASLPMSCSAGFTPGSGADGTAADPGSVHRGHRRKPARRTHPDPADDAQPGPRRCCNLPLGASGGSGNTETDTDTAAEYRGAPHRPPPRAQDLTGDRPAPALCCSDPKDDNT